VTAVPVKRVSYADHDVAADLARLLTPAAERYGTVDSG
jgi:hypothetical protein